MIDRVAFLHYVLAMIAQAMTAGMKLFAFASKDTKLPPVLSDGIRGVVKWVVGACGRKNEWLKRIHRGLLYRNRGLFPILLWSQSFYTC